MGMAVRRAGNRRPAVSVGQRLGSADAVPAQYEGRGLPRTRGRGCALRAARVRLAWRTWSATSGSGPTSIVDEHTRAAILRGGSYYQPQGSRWYFPQAYRLDEHGKYLLMAPAKDRAGTLGFRCVVDAE